MEQRPPNRAERRAQAQNKRGRPPKMLRVASPPPPLHVLSERPALGTDGSDALVGEFPNEHGPRPGESWAQADERIGAYMDAKTGDPTGTHYQAKQAADKPPSGQGAKAGKSHQAGATKRARVAAGVGTVHLLGGGLLARMDAITGEVVMERTPPAVDAWMVYYDSDANARKWMDLVFVNTPLVGLVLVYAGVATESLKRHGTSFSDLFKAKEPAPPPPGGEPSGPTAPATGPSEPPQTPLGTIPAEGLPHDLELEVREYARQHPEVTYEQVRAVAVEQLAQYIATQNGASGQMPRALGEVIG